MSRDLGIDGSQMFAGPLPLWGRPAIDLQALVAPLLCSRTASTAVQARKKVEAKLANIIMASSFTGDFAEEQVRTASTSWAWCR